MSKIEWTSKTWNPVTGCSIVSEGCTNCYAMSMARRLEVGFKTPQYEGTTRISGNRPKWTGQVNLVEKALKIPYGWQKPRLVFVNSMGDLFHEDVPFEFIDKVIRVCRENPHHQFQILTKRHKRIVPYDRHLGLWPDNVWLGVSIENYDHIDRKHYLLQTTAKIKFISFEPLLGAVTSKWSRNVDLTGIDWVIVGGESGHGARPMKEKWVDEIHDSCFDSNTKFFFKQWGAWGQDGVKRSKKANGRLYKGREMNGMPRRLS